METVSPQPAAATWDETLASYEQHLDAMATLLASGQPVDLPVWNPPTGLGPIPAALVGLATSLSDRAEEIMRTLTVTMAKTRMELEALNRPLLHRASSTARAVINTTMLDEKA